MADSLNLQIHAMSFVVFITFLDLILIICFLLLSSILFNLQGYWHKVMCNSLTAKRIISRSVVTKSLFSALMLTYNFSPFFLIDQIFQRIVYVFFFFLNKKILLYWFSLLFCQLLFYIHALTIINISFGFVTRFLDFWVKCSVHYFSILLSNKSISSGM